MSARVNITIPDELKEYFEEWSKRTGVTQSALMCLALSEYVEMTTLKSDKYKTNEDLKK
jgi:predicted transcriptional regulator